jgi:hypothetical protein
MVAKNLLLGLIRFNEQSKVVSELRCQILMPLNFLNLLEAQGCLDFLSKNDYHWFVCTTGETEGGR